MVEYGHDTIHTDDLPNRERTTDAEIRQISMEQNRIVISKDSDFVDSYMVKNIPEKLLIITTGNIKNAVLYEKIQANLAVIVSLFKTCNLVEMSNEEIIEHS